MQLSPQSLPGPVKGFAADLVARSGRLTASRRMTPSFLVAGGQRCGTTSMYKALIQHPVVLGPVLHKGIHYFDVAYDKPFDWYQAHFPLRRTGARHSTGGTAAVTFESSPYYLYHPLAAQRIAHDLPDVKLLVLVRDPVERAYSAHSHEVARGYEPVTDFETALALEPTRLAGEEDRLRRDPTARSESHRHHAYVQRGQYVDHLRRLSDELGRDRIHVVDSQGFFDNPQPCFDGVLRFLDLPVGPQPVFDRHNARSRSTLSDQLRTRLTEHFEPYDAELAEWLGSVPSWRR
ncbi:MAG TPA: sulfotransferase domain-containing protein [Mycobacteriales bacterium]|nr:sulfotransferase domain-containing protein [Mycobacteriales bacterium]